MKTRFALYIVAALALLFLVNSYRGSTVSDTPRPEKTTAEASIFDVPITVDPLGPSFVIDSRRLTAPQGIPDSETNVFALVFDDDGRVDHLTTEPDIPTFTRKNRGRIVVGVAKSAHDLELAYFFGRLASGGASVVRRQLTKTEVLSPPLFRGLRRQSAAAEANDPNAKVSIGRVAHAGGDLKGRAYTNSYEALEESYSEGFRYFEIDFNFTADSQLVCIHDWDVTWPSMFDGDATRTPTLQEFVARSEGLSGVTPCTLDGLSLWMLSHPDAVLITDVKERNLEGIELVRAAIPNGTQRVIPQIYDPKEYGPARQLGFSRILFTLYRYTGSESDLLHDIRKWEGDFGVVFTEKVAGTELGKRLAAEGIDSYVHTVNDPALIDELILNGNATEVFTDRIAPP